MQSPQHYKTKIQKTFSLFEYVLTLISQRYVLKISGKRKACLLYVRDIPIVNQKLCLIKSIKHYLQSSLLSILSTIYNSIELLENGNLTLVNLNSISDSAARVSLGNVYGWYYVYIYPIL